MRSTSSASTPGARTSNSKRSPSRSARKRSSCSGRTSTLSTTGSAPVPSAVSRSWPSMTTSLVKGLLEQRQRLAALGALHELRQLGAEERLDLGLVEDRLRRVGHQRDPVAPGLLARLLEVVEQHLGGLGGERVVAGDRALGLDPLLAGLVDGEL